MVRVETIYTQERLDEQPTYHGDIPNDPPPVLIITNEKRLNWLWRNIVGYNYSYTLTITDE